MSDRDELTELIYVILLSEGISLAGPAYERLANRFIEHGLLLGKDEWGVEAYAVPGYVYRRNAREEAEKLALVYGKLVHRIAAEPTEWEEP